MKTDRFAMRSKGPRPIPSCCRHENTHVFECVRVFSCCGFRHPAGTRGGSLPPGCLRPAARRCRERSIDAACERFSVYTKSRLRDSMLPRAFAHDCPLICVYIFIHIYRYIHVYINVYLCLGVCANKFREWASYNYIYTNICI